MFPLRFRIATAMLGFRALRTRLFARQRRRIARKAAIMVADGDAVINYDHTTASHLYRRTIAEIKRRSSLATCLGRPELICLSH